MSGQVSILNVGSGDTKLSFDNKNPAETIRASRIVRDMLRRGYALLVETVQPDGTKVYQRALDFDETANEYIVADFDASYVRSEVPAMPLPPEGWKPAAPEMHHEEVSEAQADGDAAAAPTPSPRRSSRPTKRIPANRAKAVAVARSAGG